MTNPTTQTSMQTFGDFLNTLTPEFLKKYEEHKKEREEKNAENALKYREKYGFVPNDFDIGRIERVEAENAICATCEEKSELELAEFNKGRFSKTAH